MTRFYPLYCRRSDGKLGVVAKGRKTEPNQPTDDQLDQKPDKNGVSDFYREVSPDEAKHIDWRRKLGGMLARELDWKDKNAQLGNSGMSQRLCIITSISMIDIISRNGVHARSVS